MSMLDVGDCRLDLVRGVLAGSGTSRSLTELETLFLAYMGRRIGQVIPKRELLQEVWGYAAVARSRAVDAMLVRIRAKVEGLGIHIHSLRGRGLQLTVDVAPAQAKEEAGTNGLVGRDDERRTLLSLLARPGLVSLWGPPGGGKTALAATLPGVALCAHGVQAMEEELCRRLSCSFPELDGELGRQRPVVVLDSCDRLSRQDLDVVRGWARRCPVLVISTRLVAGGSDLRLDPLALSDAEKLLGRRLDLDPDTCSELAAMTDGLPRQIELLDQAIRFLGPEGARSLGRGAFPAMEGAVEALWAELSPGEQETLGNVSVFEDSFDLAGAAAVCDRTPHAMLPILQRLWSCSMLQAGRGSFRLLAPVRSVAERQRSAQAEARWVGWCAELLADDTRGGFRWHAHFDDLSLALGRASGWQAVAIGALLIESTLMGRGLECIQSRLIREGRERPLVLALMSLAHAIASRAEQADTLAELLTEPLDDPSEELVRRVARCRREDAEAFEPLLDQVPLSVAVAMVAIAAGAGWSPTKEVERLATLCASAHLTSGARAMWSYAARGARLRGESGLDFARRGGLEGRVIAEIRAGDPEAARAVATELLETERNPHYRHVLAGMLASMHAVAGARDEAEVWLAQHRETQGAPYTELAHYLLHRPATMGHPHAMWVERWSVEPIDPHTQLNDSAFFFAWALRSVGERRS